MKKFKKLIPALCMLLVSAVMLGTTTFAWFSMNNKVTATRMQIEAKTNDTYLLISTNSDKDQIQVDKKTTVDFGMTNATKLYPSAPCMNETEESYLTTDGYKVNGTKIETAGVQIKNKDAAAAVTNWYTAQAEDATKSDIKADTAKQLTSFTDYVEAKTLYLTVAKGVNAANKLNVKPTFTALDNKIITGVKLLVVVTYADNSVKIVTISSANNNNEVPLYEQDTQHITDAGVATVSMFLYYDGNDTSVYTNNAALIGGASVSLEFTVSTVSNAAGE